MKKYLNKRLFSAIAAVTLILSCEVGNFDLQESPNYLTPSSANPTYLLNEVQYLFQNIMEDVAELPNDIMRYQAMTGSYADDVSSGVLNTVWERYYEALNTSNAIAEFAESDPNLAFHNGMNKLLIGYLTVTLIDFVGDIPYSETGNAADFPDPSLDTAEDIYKIVLADIDEAIIAIEGATFNVETDLLYDSDKAKWIAFANSFKLRILIQTRLASSAIGVTNLKDDINALINKDIIDTEAEDFDYHHSVVDEPESRHLFFRRGYISGFSKFIGNNFMWLLNSSKAQPDPRMRYYLYRQTDVDPFSGSVPYLPCGGDINADFCYVGDQYWGLDHGETRTGRGDNYLKTTYGIYPGGGAFDEDQFISADNTTNNLSGAGIVPILTASYLKFLLAESALKIGTNGDPKVLLEEGVRASMSKVLNFGNVTSTFEATSTDVNNYVDEVLSNYDNAADDDERLNIIMTEFYLAAFGNGVEAYNAYRRTGFPADLQEPINDPNPVFPRSYLYADDEVDINLSLSQKTITDKIFWDTNPDGFIK